MTIIIHYFSGTIRSGLVFDGMPTKESGMTKGSQSNNSTFGSRPTLKVHSLSVKMKPKQGIIQNKTPDRTMDTGTGKENTIAPHNKGKCTVGS